MLAKRIARLAAGNRLSIVAEGALVHITNSLVCWFLDRYFERTVFFLQRHSAKSGGFDSPIAEEFGASKNQFIVSKQERKSSTHDLLDNAKCIAVVPDLSKGGFIGTRVHRGRPNDAKGP